jgi:hypothetical protein
MGCTLWPLRLESSLVQKEIILYTDSNCLRLFTLCANGDRTSIRGNVLSYRVEALKSVLWSTDSVLRRN